MTSRINQVAVLLIMSMTQLCAIPLDIFYGFTGLDVGDVYTGSDPVLAGQDGWTLTAGPNLITVVDTLNPRAYIGYPATFTEVTAFRINRVCDDFGVRLASAYGESFGLDVTTSFNLSFYCKVRGDRAAFQSFGLGYDADLDGLPRGVSVQFGVDETNYFIREAGAGSTFTAAHDLSGSQFRYLRLTVNPLTDMGSLSVSVDGVSYTSVSGLQSIQLKLENGPALDLLNGYHIRMSSPGADDAVGPSGPLIDNITVFQDGHTSPQILGEALIYTPAAFDSAAATSSEMIGVTVDGNTRPLGINLTAYTDEASSSNDGMWKIRQYGDQSYAEGGSGETLPMLVTKVGGAIPGMLYQVEAFFLDHNDTTNSYSNYRLNVGLTPDSLREAFGDYTEAFRCRGVPYAGALPEDVGDTHVAAVRVGVTRADESGFIRVYVSGSSNSENQRTNYLGVGIRRCPVLFSPYSTADEYYIAPNGDNSNPGTTEEPWLTFLGARDNLRVLRGDHPDPVVVWVSGGTFLQSSSLTFDERDSWISFRAVSGNKVILTGGLSGSGALEKEMDPAILGRLITAGASDHLYRMDLSAFGVSDLGVIHPRGFGRPSPPSQQVEVYIDNRRLAPSQYPNAAEGGIPIGDIIDTGSIPRNGETDNRGGIFTYDSSRPDQWINAEDLWIKGYFKYGWSDDLLPVASLDPSSNQITTSMASYYGFAKWSSGTNYRRFYGVHLLEEVDAPGECWIDRVSGVLYFYPPVGTDPTQAKWAVTILDSPMLVITDACHLVFDGIDFGLTRSSAVSISGGRGCMIRDADISRNGNHAIQVDSGHDHSVVRCRIHDCGSGGVQLNGGNVSHFTNGRNRVDACEIYDVNRHEQTYRSAVNIRGQGHRVRQCLIHNIPQMGLLLAGAHHEVSYNEFGKVFYDAGNDSGCIYMGRTPIGWNRMHHNLFIDVANKSPYATYSWAVYLDDGYFGAEVTQNVFARAGKGHSIFIGGGSENKIEDNIFVDCDSSIRMDDRLATWSSALLDSGGMFDNFLQSVDFLNPPWSLRVPELVNFWSQSPATPYNKLTRNLCVRTNAFSINSGMWTGTSDTQISNPGFVHGLSLSRGSRAHNQMPEFNPGDVREMGQRQPASEVIVRDWNKALRRIDWLAVSDVDYTLEELRALLSDAQQGPKVLIELLFPGQDPDGFSATAYGEGIFLQPNVDEMNLTVRMHAEAVALVGFRLESSSDLVTWSASSQRLERVEGKRLDGFETYEASAVKFSAGEPSFFYRLSIDPLNLLEPVQ
jgi:hypothetical protein